MEGIDYALKAYDMHLEAKETGIKLFFRYPHDRESIIFHGGCLSRRGHGTRCTSHLSLCPMCRYFKPNWDLPDLHSGNKQEDK